MEDAEAGIFVEALRQVFDETGLRLDAIEPEDRRRPGPRDAGPTAQVIASVGITGDLRGNLALGADRRSADGILRGMSAGLPLPDDRLGEFPRAALGEIANQVAGRAVTLLAAHDRRCDITPPTVVSADCIDSLLAGSTATWTVRGSFGTVLLVAARDRRKSS